MNFFEHCAKQRQHIVKTTLKGFYMSVLNQVRRESIRVLLYCVRCNTVNSYYILFFFNASVMFIPLIAQFSFLVR